MKTVSRVTWSILGAGLLALACLLEVGGELLVSVLAGAPDVARPALDAVLARGPGLHLSASVIVFGGLVSAAAPWPATSGLALMVGRALVSAFGAIMMLVGGVMAFSPDLFARVADVRASPPSEDGVSIVIYGAAALLGFLGATIAASPWRREAGSAA